MRVQAYPRGTRRRHFARLNSSGRAAPADNWESPAERLKDMGERWAVKLAVW